LKASNDYSFIKYPDECGAHNIHLVGGKASSLGELFRANVPVPPFFVITTKGFQEFMNYNNLLPAVSRLDNVEHDDEKLLALSKEIREKILTASLPKHLEKELGTAFHEIISVWGSIAVRSSATLEDVSEASFAGQYESYLGIKTSEQFYDAVIKCYASLFNDRAVLYRNRINKAHTNVHMAVIAQSLVRARSAGVMFTVNPINGDPSVNIIESSWGLGEAVVKGEVIPDSYMISKVTGEVLKLKTSKNKPIKYETLDDGSVVKVENPPEGPELSLSKEEAVFLGDIGIKLEQYFGRPQDIEWVVDKRFKPPENIFVVQSRPVTVNTTVSKASRQTGLNIMDRIIQTLMAGARV
jgi:pyruvate,water dikinase